MPGGANWAFALSINLPARLLKLLRAFGHAGLQRLFGFQSFFLSIVADRLGDLHAAEFGAAHGTEVGEFGALRRQGFVVVGAGAVGVQ